MNINQPNKNKRKPSAQWRSPEEFRRLTKEGKYTRCGKIGHGTRNCSKFGPAKNPAFISHINDNNVAKEELPEDNETLEYGSTREFSGED